MASGIALLSPLVMLGCGGSTAANHTGSSGAGGGASELGGAGGTPSSPGVRFAWVEPVPAQIRAAAAATTKTELRTYVNRATAGGSVVVGNSTLWVYRTADDFSQQSEDFRWTEGTGSVSLGNLPGVDTSSAVDLATLVSGMSADGSVLVGMTAGAGGSRVAFRWTSATGMVELRALSATTITDIVGVSADGSAVAGTLLTNSGRRAFRWTTPAGMVVLDPVPGDTSSEATWMSADGSVVAGDSSHDGGQQAFRWTAEGGVVGLGFLPMATSCGLQTLPTTLDGSALFGTCGDNAFQWTASAGIVNLGSLPGYNRFVPWGMSTDGSAITGDAINPAGDSQVFYWSAKSGLLGLGFLPGDAQSNSRPITGMSSDGSVVVGISSAASGDSVAFRWTKASGMQRLAPLPGENQSTPVTVSADGSLSGGDSIQHWPGTNPTAGPDAVIWRAAGPPISVAASLEAAAVDLTGAQLKSCFVSGDASTLLGIGSNESGGIRGFVAHLAL